MLRSLNAAHPSFQVRLYDALPTFRIVLIDQTVASFSPYLMAPGTQRARTGWEAPHIVLDRTAPWPLAQTFKRSLRKPGVPPPRLRRPPESRPPP